MDIIYRLPDIYSAFRVMDLKYSKTLKDWYFPLHRHTYFEFLYCVSGSLTQTINSKEYVLNSGDAILIKAGTLHSTLSTTEAIWFGFHFDIEMKEVYEIMQKIAVPHLPVSVNWNESKSLKVWMEQFISELSQYSKPNGMDSTHGPLFMNIDTSLQLMVIHSHLLEFIISLTTYFQGQNLLNQAPSLHGSQYAIAHQTSTLLENSAYEPLKVNEIAKRLNVHRSHLYDCFKKVYGMSPRYYWNQIRMHEAKKMLQETDHTIEEIAEKLCYSSVSHFCYSFKQMIKLTPQQFRNHLSIKEKSS